MIRSSYDYLLWYGHRYISNGPLTCWFNCQLTQQLIFSEGIKRVDYKLFQSDKWKLQEVYPITMRKSLATIKIQGLEMNLVTLKDTVLMC